MWVANLLGDSVTEISAATGDLVRVITGWKYHLDGTASVSSDGTHVWATNADQSVTEFPA